MALKSKSSNVIAVQTTNDSSLLSKHSMITAGYFCDPFIGEFVNKCPKGRTSLINRGYYIRAKAIESAIITWLTHCKANLDSHCQVVSLGAGFDTLYFRLSNDGISTDVKVFEIDYQDVVQRKAVLIKNSSVLSSHLPSDAIYHETKGEGIVLESSSYNLIGVDMKKVDILERELIGCHLDFALPTLLLSECAITYMREIDSSKLIQWVSNHFKDCTFTTYEQISPDDGFGKVMVNHFQTTGSPLLSVAVHKTALLQQKRYLNLGWSVCEVMDMNTFYQNILTEDERRRVNHLEIFEEFEEFHQKCAHYVLINASRGRLSNYASGLFNGNNIIDANKTFDIELDANIENVKRFGHRSVLLSSKFIVTIGGFGMSPEGHHRRLPSIGVSTIDSGENTLVLPSTNILQAGIMYHSMSEIDDNTVVIFGGRTSPTSAFADVYFVSFDVNNNAINTWQPIIEKKSTNLKGPSARWRHSSTSLIINGRMKVFIFGGRSTIGTALNDCYCLNVDSLEWTEMLTNLNNSSPPPCHSHSACAWQTKMLISGGLDNNSMPMNSIYILDCLTSQWSRINSSGLKQRYSHTSNVYKDKLYLVGGVNTTINSPGVAVVDLNTWQCIELSLPILPQPVILYKHSSVVIPDEEAIVVLGGGGNCFSFGTHFNKCALKIKLTSMENVH